MNRRWFRFHVGWSLLLLLTLLPGRVSAEEGSQAMLYIEWVYGDPIKVPITPGYPILTHGVEYGSVGMLYVTYKDPEEKSLRFQQSDIIRLYTGYEATGIVATSADTGLSSVKVYSLSGRYVGSDSHAMEGQPKGVYIIKKGTNHIKIVKP